jgi:alpha-D-ribose 1-methylphosphonate 5-triphosphate synthase subunit PhnG
MPNSHQQKEHTMSTTITRAVGERVELARYRISTGERVLYGQRIAGVVRITDVPARAGRSYLVERELEHDGYAALQAIVSDYIQQSEDRDEPAILVS